MELEKKMADSAAGRRDEEHQKKKAEILANLTMREFVRSPKDNCDERNRTLNKSDMTKAETEGTKQGSQSTKEETENIKNSNVELVEMTSFDDSRVDEEVEILTAKAEYAREMSMRKRDNSQGAKTKSLLEEDHAQDFANSPNIGKKSILLDPNNRHSSQKVSFVEVEEQIQSLSLSDGVKRSSSGKHVTYQEDLVADNLLGEERIRSVTENNDAVEKQEAADEEKKAKRRKMIENAKRRKAEAEARIEAEKAARSLK